MSDWERLTGYVPGGGSEDMRLARIPVPGGWLYRTIEIGLGVAMVFVPEPVVLPKESEPPEPPASDFEAEAVVLGTLLRWPQFHEALASELDGRHFADPIHGRVFDRAVTCFRDLAFEMHELPGVLEGDLDEVGGLAYLAHLKTKATDLVTALLAARRVVAAHLDREWQLATSAGVAQAGDHRGNPL